MQKVHKIDSKDINKQNQKSNNINLSDVHTAIYACKLCEKTFSKLSDLEHHRKNCLL